MYAVVAVARPFPEPLTYGVPALLSDRLAVGHAVLVPLRGGAETGYVVALADATDINPSKIKPISRLVDPEPVFDRGQLQFFRWVADYYLAPLGLVIHTALPSRMRLRTVRSLYASTGGVDALTAGDVDGKLAQVLREAISRPGLTRRGMVRRLDGELDASGVRSAIDGLVRRGFAEWEDREVGGAGGTVRTVVLQGTHAEALERVPRAGRRMVAVLSALARAEGPMDLPALLAPPASNSPINALIWLIET